MTWCLWPCATAVVARPKRSRDPLEVVRHVRELLAYVANNREGCGGGKRERKMADLSKSIKEMKCILYGDGEADPVEEACMQLTKEFFKEKTDTFRLLIVCLPYLDLETQKDVTQVIANLQRQKVGSRLVASVYLEANLDLLDILMSGYDNLDIAIHYSTLIRDCIRHQVVARYVLGSPHVRKFFDYIQFPDFNIQSDAFKTFKELVTRHKSTAAEFFSKNYDWFFAEFNSKLISSSNYIIRRQSIQLLGDILLERSNTAVMARYVISKEHLMVLMNLLRDQSKVIQVEAFHVFKLFAANQNKPPEIVSILRTNRSKLLRFLGDFTLDKEDAKFETDKAKVISEILALAMQ
ncbi:putative MO25-like protein At5g47540 [Phragmites australis]|uniref:putative MO25-like protein At5g47540 n=1 Tax=Phragmites australis TaxID=29695 RepID=UPI002D79E2F2|nr:putative MO25-like protein At5g47540 [Phragmites australis]